MSGEQTTAAGHADTARKPAPGPGAPQPKRKQLPPYKLLLHDDDLNTMDDVVRAIVVITPLDPHQAIARMLEAHKTGTAMLLATHKERGELYVEQFASARITTTLERGP